jgi:hypothetical protein
MLVLLSPFTELNIISPSGVPSGLSYSISLSAAERCFDNFCS